MAKITSLPQELLSGIFGHIERVEHLAVCRLVCRGWNYLAEQRMLGEPIFIENENQAIQLYNQLCRNPSNGNLIKSLHWDIRQQELPPIYEKLMAIAFTPTMESLDGITHTDKIFDILTSIADTNSCEFKNLQGLPTYSGDEGGYLKALTLKRLKASTLSIGIRLWDTMSINWKVIDLLDDFNTLKFLTLSDFTVGWSDIDLILQKCHFLETLTFLDFNSGIHKADKEEVQSLLIQNKVTKEPSMKTIEFIQSTLDPPFVEYLIYKYPNVTRLEIAGYANSDSFDDYHRILDAIKEIPSKEVELGVLFEASMEETNKFAASRSEKIEFEREYGLVMKVN